MSGKILTIGEDYRMEIPEELRDKLRPGQTFALVPRGNGFVIVPVPTLEELQEIFQGSNPEGYRERGPEFTR